MKYANSSNLPIAIIGGGVAGSAIAQQLMCQGRKVHLFCRNPGEGSSFTNQKWHHSGLLYVHEKYFKTAWTAYSKDRAFFEKYICQKRNAWFIALDPNTLIGREKNWNNWAKPRGCKWRQLDQEEFNRINVRFRCNAVAGFEVPDEIIDFPRMIADLQKEVQVDYNFVPAFYSSGFSAILTPGSPSATLFAAARKLAAFKAR